MSIFLDFDGTITVRDTVGELANSALRLQGDAERSHLEPRWREVVQAYVTDFKAHAEGHRPEERERLGPADEVTFLRAGKEVETRSLDRVRECGIFRGVTGEQLRDAGRRLVEESGDVKLRPGFREFVESSRGSGWRIWVVSVNWSRSFIEGACGLGGDGVEVIANEVCEEDGSVVGPAILNLSGGEEERREMRILTNSYDKLEVMERVLRRESLGGKPAFYFGDSTTDLECLLAATKGIVVSDSDDSSLLRTLKRIGKVVPHVGDSTSEKDRGLVWARDFEEVLATVHFGLDGIGYA